MGVAIANDASPTNDASPRIKTCVKLDINRDTWISRDMIRLVLTIPIEYGPFLLLTSEAFCYGFKHSDYEVLTLGDATSIHCGVSWV